MADHAEARRQPGEDRPVSPADDLTVVNAVREFKKEAENARRTRLKRNRVNREAFLSQQDWSHKRKGQSREFLPKTSVAVEQLTAFIKRALTQFGAWYEPVLGRGSKSPISATQIRALMDCYLGNLVVEDGKVSNFATQLTDGIKSGSLESLIIFKIHGVRMPHREFVVEPGDPFVSEGGTFEVGEDQLITEESDLWHLRIDLVRQEDYFPDPTGRGLFEIHSTEHDLHYLQDRADEGVYDPEVVSKIEEDFTRKEEETRRPQSLGQDESKAPGFRRKVVIDEFWGDLLDSKGKIVHKNIFCAIANDKWIIRRPQPNPFWHQESPFLAVPLIRVPFSVWHKALMDDAVQLNLALNELFNLFVDGALSSVWGIKQLRIDELERPEQVSDGIAQGDTLLIKSTVPHNVKVLEKVVEGEIPSDAMAIFELMNREFTTAALSNELKMGALPPKQVRATEVVELSQSQAVTTDSIVADIELELVTKALRKAWLTILQNLDDASAATIVAAIGERAALQLSQMSPAERFAAFAHVCQFKVFGLSALLAKVRDFQKIMALMQSISANPLLLQAFFRKYSPDKLIAHIMRTLSINPEQMEADEEEMARKPADLKQLQQFQELQKGTQGAGGQQNPDPGSGEQSLPAEINQIGGAGV